MPNIEDNSNKTKSIRIRFTPKELEVIKKFVKDSKFYDISKYFRFLDESYRAGDLIQKNNDKSELTLNALKEIDELKKLHSENEKESKKVREKLDSIYKIIQESSKNRVSGELKGQVLLLLEKGKYTRLEISKILNIDENLVADILAELLNKKLIDYNKKTEYFVIEKQ